MSVESKGKVAVAILNWNGREHLEPCLEALDQQQDPGVEWEVLILDNGSSDDSWQWLGENWPKGRQLASDCGRPGTVRCFRLDHNLGFCAGNNWLAERTDAEFLAFLNNDTRAHSPWLGSLVDALAGAGDDVAAVSGVLIDWSEERLDFARGGMTFDGHAFQRGFGQPLASVRLPELGEEMPFACGGNMMVKRQRFLDAGGFDPQFFAYLEDVDLGWRLWSRGDRVVASPGAVAAHRSMASSDHLGQFNRGFLFERNAFLTAYKNYDNELWPRLMPAVLWTLMARTQTLLVENNPGGRDLELDPYAQRALVHTGVAADHGASQDPPIDPSLWRKWRGWGTKELVRRGVRRLRRNLARGLDPDRPVQRNPLPDQAPRLEDPRTVAQFRALSHLLGNLESSADARRRIQAQRRRPDREIFAKFPPLIVPTYPGDERLFSSSAFSEWLPEDMAFERSSLDQLMAL